MRVVVAEAPALEKRYDNSYPSLGVLYIISYLRHAIPGIEVKYLESNCNLKQHIDYLRNFRPSIYGISVTSKTLRLAAATIAAVREQFPDTVVVCGGPHPTALPQQTLQITNADIVVKGEGEETFVEIVKALENRTDLADVPGITFKAKERIFDNPNRPLIKNLDEIPFPAWDLVDHKKYPGMHLKMQPVESSLVISRGCPYNCTFCSNPVWKLCKPWLRYRSHDNIIEEIKYLYSRGVREIYLSSDEVNFNLQWANGLLDRIIALELDDLYFQCNLRADRVNEEFAEKLAKAQFWLIHLGMESGNNRVLRGLQKKITVEQIENATDLLSARGTKIFGFMMLYNAWEEDGKLRFETSAEVDNSIELCRNLLKNKKVHYMSWQFCTPLPGSKLYDIAKRHNLMVADDLKVWEQFDEHYVAMKLPGITHKEMLGKIKKGILIKDWYMLKSGRINLRHLWRAKENILALLRGK